MNYLNKMRREDHVSHMNRASSARHSAVKFVGSPDLRQMFIDEVRSALRFAAQDRGYAVNAGWKLP